MKTILKTRQRGMSVVVVVMLSSVAAAVVFSALNTTLTQSRMSGNFQKAINAEYMADKAIYDSYHKLNALLKSNPTVSDQELAAIALQDKLLSSTNRQYASKAAILAAGLLDLTTDGYFYHDSQSKSRVLLRRFNGGSGSNSGNGNNGGALFFGGLIGCEGVDLGGGGAISSYNSVDPSAESVSLIRTIKPNADIVFASGSAGWVYGNVWAQGNIEVKNSQNIQGELKANGWIKIANTPTISSSVLAGKYLEITNDAKIKGDAKANEYIKITAGGAILSASVLAGKYLEVTSSSTIQGIAQANEWISITNGSKLYGGIKTLSNLTVKGGPDVMGDTWVKGDISIPNWVANGSYFKNKNRVFYGGTTEHNFGQRSANINITPVPLIAPIPDEWQDIAASSASNVCDPLDIASIVAPLKRSGLPILKDDWSGTYVLTPSKFTKNGKEELKPNDNVAINLSGKLYPFYSVSQFEVMNLLTVDGGDVVVFVNGQLRLTDGNPKIKINEGSSLTLILTGQALLHNGSIETPVSKLTATGMPAFSILSAFSSANENGVSIGNGFNGAYGAIYAPLAPALINGHAIFSGSLISRKITVSGSGQIKYDSALTKANIGGNTGTPEPAGTPRITFSGWS